LQFVEVEFVDGLQRFGSGAFLKVVGQGLEPSPVFGLEGRQDSDRILPASSPASAIGRSPVMDYRHGSGAGSAMAGLALGIGQGLVAEGLAGHGFFLQDVTLRNAIQWLADRPTRPPQRPPSRVFAAGCRR
jgi:hypothetical protein